MVVPSSTVYVTARVGEPATATLRVVRPESMSVASIGVNAVPSFGNVRSTSRRLEPVKSRSSEPDVVCSNRADPVRVSAST